MVLGQILQLLGDSAWNNLLEGLHRLETILKYILLAVAKANSTGIIISLRDLITQSAETHTSKNLISWVLRYRQDSESCKWLWNHCIDHFAPLKPMRKAKYSIKSQLNSQERGKGKRNWYFLILIQIFCKHYPIC